MTVPTKSDGEELTAAEFNEVAGVTNRSLVVTNAYGGYFVNEYGEAVILPSVADAAAAVNAAIADGYKVIRLKPGTYTATTVLNPTSAHSVSILGAGFENCRWNYTGSGTNAMIFGNVTTRYTSLVLQDFKVNAPSATGAAILVQNMSYVTVNRVYFLTSTRGLQLSNAVYFAQIFLPVFRTNTGAGLYIDSGCSSIDIWGGEFIDNGGTGDLAQVIINGQVSFNGKTADTVRFHGTFFETISGGAVDHVYVFKLRSVKFIGCTFTNTKDATTYQLNLTGDSVAAADSTLGTVIVGCSFQGTAKNAIGLDYAQNTIIDGNYFTTTNKALLSTTNTFGTQLGVNHYNNSSTPTTTDNPGTGLFWVMPYEQQLAARNAAFAFRNLAKLTSTGFVLGDASESLQVNVSAGGGMNIAGRLQPEADGTRPLGSSALRWNEGFFADILVLAQNAANANVRLTTAGIFLGAGGATPVDIQLSRGAANRLDLAIDDGLRLAGGTTTVRDALTQADGTIWYNTSTSKLQVRAGGAWVDLH